MSIKSGFKKFFKERVLIHHTELDLIRVSIVRGKGHCHLELREGQDIKEITTPTLHEALSRGIEFLGEQDD